MTSPSVELFLPKTYIFERKNRSYGDAAFMTRQDRLALDFVYLPKGLSMVTVTATGLGIGRGKVELHGVNGYRQELMPMTGFGDQVTFRMWSGQISNPGEGNQGLWLKVQLQNITSSGMNNGSVSIQIVNFPPET